MTKKNLLESIEKSAAHCLVGRKIVAVRYATPEEVRDLGLYSAPIMIVLDDGHSLVPLMDDKFSDAGALYTNILNLDVIPSMRRHE
jgi:hypothetical protein